MIWARRGQCSAIPGRKQLKRDLAVKRRKSLAQAERMLIQQALEDAGGNVSATARALGIERARLHKRIRVLGLSKGNAS
jgi:DNA-binding NtrC family response regulator